LNERVEVAEARQAKARAEAEARAGAIEEIEAVEPVEAAEVDGNRRGGRRGRRIHAQQLQGAAVGAMAEIIRGRRGQI
jgi:hypothetical protein